ncbi:hypothetical protein UFOVP29_194 [uncultured Caudovirales phage]|uniref:Uncharacterized protein n=1 Tax=uncultured Caudovirales phage TaxID=2100421 RepID=A0A6J5KNV1_9CAUD|nr:hypothetical protein UFOVP29_194 [uncultured Caudovirales phage]
MTISLTLIRVNPDTSITTLGQITTNSTAYLPSNFVIVDYPNTPGVHEYQLVASSPDTYGDSIVYNNMNLAGLYIKR